MKKYNKLVISPHIDDEILGCGGILDENTFILHCGVENRYINGDMSISVVTRISELEKVSDFLKFDFKLLDNKVNSYKLNDLIGEFEKNINQIKQEQVYIPYPSYNQDHRIVYEAALVALRPHDINFFVKKILVYEQPHVYLWDKTHNINGTFIPNYFVPINVDKKIKAYEYMKTQVRNFRSPEQIKSMATLRGAQSNSSYSEAFQILRWVE